MKVTNNPAPVRTFAGGPIRRHPSLTTPMVRFSGDESQAKWTENPLTLAVLSIVALLGLTTVPPWLFSDKSTSVQQVAVERTTAQAVPRTVIAEFPPWLRFLQENIDSYLPASEALSKKLSGVSTQLDANFYNRMKHQFAVWLLMDPKVGMKNYVTDPQASQLLQEVAEMHNIVVQGSQIPAKDWKLAYDDLNQRARGAFTASEGAKTPAEKNQLRQVAMSLVVAAYTVSDKPIGMVSAAQDAAVVAGTGQQNWRQIQVQMRTAQRDELLRLLANKAS